MRRTCVALFVVFLVVELSGSVGAYSIGPWNVQDQVVKNYTDDEHTLGKFAAIVGTKNAVKYDSYILLSMSVSHPDPVFASQLSTFDVAEGSGWSECKWIFCTYFWPDIRVKKYEAYYYYETDYPDYPKFGIEYSNVQVYREGSNIDKLNSIYEDILNAVLSLAGSPVDASLLFDLFEAGETDSGPINGLMTDHLTVNLKTGTQWYPYYDEYYADYGLILYHINVYKGSIGQRKPRDIDVIDLDATYTIEPGTYYQSFFMDYPQYTSNSEDKVTLYFVNIWLEWRA